MAVKQIKAWQISTGNAYASKMEAYNEEMVYLIQTRGTANKPGVGSDAFDIAIEQQRTLCTALNEMRESLGTGKKDQKIAEGLDRLIVSADEWLASASELKDAIKNIEY